jgi:hypothetical protein
MIFKKPTLMKTKFVFCAALSCLTHVSYAAVSAEEAKQLGQSLTLFGAIKAGNSSGSIPPYTGGLTKPPVGFNPGSGVWTDPYKDEKPLFRIDAKNLAQHSERLSEGQKQMLTKFPTYYIDVYPTHRSTAYPESVLKATVRNATGCQAKKDGEAVESHCRGGMPFPIPKTGREAMWNQLLSYRGDTGSVTENSRSWVIDSTGRPIMTAEQKTLSDFPYYQTEQADRDTNMVWRTYSYTKSPARRAGEMTGLTDFTDPKDKPRRAWTYTPGQRRVKRSPEFAYDTPVASMGGVILFDELFVFSGAMDRFDFKLVGKKEMYIPYNSYRSTFECPAPEKALLPKHANPACERWELHRVWVIEATLKSGQRHAYSRRTYYFDEDLSGAGMFDAFDQANELHRSLFNGTVQLYDVSIPYSIRTVVYDFKRQQYAYLNDISQGGVTLLSEPLSERALNPEAVVGRESAR